MNNIDESDFYVCDDTLLLDENDLSFYSCNIVGKSDLNANQVGGALPNNPDDKFRQIGDLNNYHLTIIFDVSDDNISIIKFPQYLINKLNVIRNDLGEIKIQTGIKAKFINTDGEIKDRFISDRAVIYDNLSNIRDSEEKLIEIIANYNESGSGWTILQILEYFFTITKFSSISYASGSSYIETPPELASKKCIINVQNHDNLCFLYAILALLKYNEITNNRQRYMKYVDYLKELKYNIKDFPMKTCNISNFERINKLSINVFTYEPKNKIPDDKNDIIKHPFVNIIHKSKFKFNNKINLLLLNKNNNFHYVSITNLNRLLNNYDNFSLQIRSKWCHDCLHGYRLEKAYLQHLSLCSVNTDKETLYEMPENNQCKFSDYSKTISPPYIIYADFESAINTISSDKDIHTPIAAGLLILGPNNYSKYYHFIGLYCVKEFLNCINSLIIDIVIPYYNDNGNYEMIMTPSDELSFYNAKKCYLCNKINNHLVRDHDHFNGKYLGASCNQCNLSRKIRRFLPIVFHNLRGYDLHHILKYAISDQSNWKLSCIPQTTEKFQALTVTINKIKDFTIKFLDSLQFLNSSLRNLANNLTTFPLTSLAFPNNIIKSKGIFPFHLSTSVTALENITIFPSKWDNINDVDYAEACNIYSQLNCTNLKEYMLHYLKVDVYLLADIFETLRKKAKSEDGLEPVNYFSIPGLSWDSALKSCPVEIELLQDPEMYKFFESGIRGGMTFVKKHYATSDTNTSLFYIDVNNLYGWALSQPLPFGDFQWVNDNEFCDIINRIKITDMTNDDRGFVLQLDFEIPSNLHDKLDDLPLAPERKTPPNGKVAKLLLTHETKYNYVIHFRLLKIFLQLGIKIIKVHRIISFKQGFVFKDYIDYNSKKRAESNNKFDKDFYKLKNNSLYGKTVENLRKRMNLRLINNNLKSFLIYTSLANFKRSIRIDNDLIALLLEKKKVILDRPSYIGQVVLDLSKLRMYELQYLELQKYRELYHCQIDILAGDTDSFFLRVSNIDLNNKLIPEMIKDNILDTSNYPVNHPHYSPNYVIGKFKDESNGTIRYKEWVFLKPKCYSLLSENEYNTTKSKGISIKQTKIKHYDYLNIYNNGGEMKVKQERIVSINHQLYTNRSTKIALRGIDDKRCWLSQNRSVAYGHYCLRK